MDNTIEVKLANGDTQMVRGHVFDGIAAHESVNRRIPPYTVTHLPTSGVIAFYDDEETAVAAATAASSVEWGGVKIGLLLPCEAVEAAFGPGGS